MITTNPYHDDAVQVNIFIGIYTTVRVFSTRQITALYYLNPNWEESMGGQLRVHIASGRGEGKGGALDAGVRSGGRMWDIDPVLDRLVLFRSDLVDHEVGLLVALYTRGSH